MMKITFSQYAMEFEYEYGDGEIENIVFTEPTDEIIEKPFGDEKKDDEKIKYTDVFEQFLKRCIKCEDFDKFIKDLKSKTTLEQAFKMLRREAGKQREENV